jgi:hypothetical protein
MASSNLSSSRIYVPGQYLTQIKRPGQRYIMHGIILENFALWVLCSILHAPSPVTHVIGLLALLIWAIYERGYVDNDWVALHHEKDPKLSDTVGKLEVADTPTATVDLGRGLRAGRRLPAQQARRVTAARRRCLDRRAAWHPLRFLALQPLG